MIRKREKTYYGPRDIYVSWACFPRRMVYLPRVLLSPVRLAAAAAVSFWSCRPPIVVPVSCVAAVPVVLGAHCAPAVIVPLLVLVVLFPSLSSSLPFSSSCRPCRVVPVLLLVFVLVLVFLARCFLRVFVISCCPCCPAVLLSFRVVLVAVSGPSGSLWSLLVLIVLAMIVPRSVLVFLCCGVAILDNT